MLTEKQMNTLEAANSRAAPESVLTGPQLGAAANDGTPPQVLMIAGCWSANAAAAVAGTGITAIGTTNPAIAPEQGAAIVATLGALANGASLSDAAKAGSQAYKWAPSAEYCRDNYEDPNGAGIPAGLVWFVPPI
jgi:hypothetical protein